VTTNGTLTEHRRYLYRGYLQIDSPPPRQRLTPSGQSLFAHCPTGLTAVGCLACCDLTRTETPALWHILWDPTQETATRPLAIQKNGTWYTYGWDLTKNICETYRTDGRIDLAYTYTPYGEVSPAHAYDQPIRWSSEYHDVELGFVYYNYRHYNPAMGRWMGREYIGPGEYDSLRQASTGWEKEISQFFNDSNINFCYEYNILPSGVINPAALVIDGFTKVPDAVGSYYEDILNYIK
ncbi:MAG: hypothetical protein MJ051_00735, partial [Akkermansia sp.]|nr:hypothetical protein [Akkermansia sp.]